MEQSYPDRLASDLDRLMGSPKRDPIVVALKAKTQDGTLKDRFTIDEAVVATGYTLSELRPVLRSLHEAGRLRPTGVGFLWK